MKAAIDLPAELLPVQEALDDALERVARRFDEQLRSDLLAVGELVAHLERFRGKMLRPALCLLSAMAAGDQRRPPGQRITSEHVTLAAVCEMVHMATLVHDDVLDEADMRRRGATINHLQGNEAAVILGDYLIAAAYELCSQLGDQRAALLVAQTSMTVCAGELVQLSTRRDCSLDRETYFAILDGKTASLIAAACELGARHAGADEAVCASMREFGRLAGVAFQIQDDLLDLFGEEDVVGKSVRRDLAKGKLTLPAIEHLAAAGQRERARALVLLEAAAAGDERALDELVETLRRSPGVASAREAAESRVSAARELLSALAPSPARAYLHHVAGAIITRRF